LQAMGSLAMKGDSAKSDFTINMRSRTITVRRADRIHSWSVTSSNSTPGMRSLPATHEVHIGGAGHAAPSQSHTTSHCKHRLRKTDCIIEGRERLRERCKSRTRARAPITQTGRRGRYLGIRKKRLRSSPSRGCRQSGAIHAGSSLCCVIVGNRTVVALGADSLGG